MKNWLNMLLDIARPIPLEPPIDHAPALALERVTIHYGDFKAIHNAAFSIQPGELMALVGPSGCGKSSLLNSINRMTDLIPDCQVDGTITIDGCNIDDIEVIELRRRVGMVFQQPNPFPLSIAENIRFPLREHGIKNRPTLRRRTEEVLRAVGLWDEVHHRLDSPAMALSGGQQQRLCIARTLALSPQIILFDEPCSALDPIASQTIEQLIATLKGRYTMLMVTHNLAQARRIADSIAVCWTDAGCGCVVETGSNERIFNAPHHPVTRAYCRGEAG